MQHICGLVTFGILVDIQNSPQ